MVVVVLIVVVVVLVVVLVLVAPSVVVHIKGTTESKQAKSKQASRSPPFFGQYILLPLLARARACRPHPGQRQ